MRTTNGASLRPWYTHVISNIVVLHIYYKVCKRGGVGRGVGVRRRVHTHGGQTMKGVKCGGGMGAHLPMWQLELNNIVWTYNVVWTVFLAGVHSLICTR